MRVSPFPICQDVLYQVDVPLAGLSRGPWDIPGVSGKGLGGLEDINLDSELKAQSAEQSPRV